MKFPSRKFPSGKIVWFLASKNSPATLRSKKIFFFKVFICVQFSLQSLLISRVAFLNMCQHLDFKAIWRMLAQCVPRVCLRLVKLLQKMKLERLLIPNRSYCVKHLNKSMNTHFDTYYSNMQPTNKLVSSMGMLGNLSSGRQGRCRCLVFHIRVGAKHQH